MEATASKMLQLSPTQVFSIALAALVLTCAWRISQNIFLSPLRQIPGPLLARITGQWLLFVELAGNRTSTIHKLHKRYGPVVRIGPDEISFSDIECVKEIYSQQTVYMKAPVYEISTMEPAIFSMTSKEEHSQRRRLLSPVFSPSNIYDCEPLITKQIDIFIRRVESHIKHPINALLTLRMLAVDIVGEIFLGNAFGALEQEEPHAFLQDSDKHFLLAGLNWNFPLLYMIFSRLPIPAVQRFFAARTRIAEYGHDAFTSYIQRYGRKSPRKDLLTRILDLDSDGKGSPLTDREIYLEVGNMVHAGTDTTSTTLTYLFWELTQNPSWQDRLRAELSRALSAESNEPISYRSVRDLQVLDAIVNESLRLHPAAPGSLARVTPRGGRKLGGVFVPENTIVSMQCYTTHRDPAAFPSPETFNPERWLTPEGPTDAMKELFMPFSKGSRACLGRTLALMELKLTTATVIQRFVVAAALGFAPSEMDMKDHFLAIPKGERCELVFTKVKC